MDKFHKENPDICLGISEHSCESVLNWHSNTTRCRDYTEKYQCLYHEDMANALEDRPWIWASHVWNMFDFGCAARKEGGVAGRNNKGLVTIDRKTCKDSFYIYRAYWSKAPMIHIAVCRYVQLVGKTTEIKAYSNQDSATLFLNGESVGRSVLIGCSVSKPHWTRAPMTFPEGRYSVRDTMEEIAKNEETFAIIAKAIKLAINVDLKPDMDMWNMIKAITPETAAK